MLKVQEYLRSGKTLADLESEYAIKSRICEELGVVCLNYSQIASPMGERICQECRALILDLSTWEVASRSFDKFFNYGQEHAADIDWKTARVLEKLDGSLVCLYHRLGEWRIATKGVADASGVVGVNSMTFRDLVIQTIEDTGKSFDQFTSKLCPDWCYSFELTAPENRIIIDYKERQLTLIGIWDRSTLHEMSIALAMDCYKKVRVYSLNLGNIDDLCALAAEFPSPDFEGYVVVDKNWNRVKVKSPVYVAASHLISGLVNTKQQLELILSDKCDDVLVALPDMVRSEIELVQMNVGSLCAHIRHIYSVIEHIPEQKEFAKAALAYPFSSVLFSIRKGKTADESLRQLTIDSALGIYNGYMEATPRNEMQQMQRACHQAQVTSIVRRVLPVLVQHRPGRCTGLQEPQRAYAGRRPGSTQARAETAD